MALDAFFFFLTAGDALIESLPDPQNLAILNNPLQHTKQLNP